METPTGLQPHQTRPHKPLSSVAARCKKLAGLCKIAFVIFALWNLFALILMCGSLFSAGIPDSTIPIAVALLVVFALYSADTCLLPLILSNMLSDLSTERTPFTLKNAKRLNWLGVVMVLYAILGVLLDITDTEFLLRVGDASIQIGTMVTDFASNEATALDLFPLVIAAVFFALSYVFKYGVLLQQESDETL